MQDTSIKGNGTSRFIKGASSFPSSFEEFRRQIVAGTLTADIGLNPAGCDVVGTALSKANLLTDDVANRLGLTSRDKTVNEALNKLFTFAADGKRNCAAAVSAMGVPTAEEATFDTIAANIRSIKTGPDVSGVTVKPYDVRSGKYYVDSSGIKREGSLISRTANSLSYTTVSGKINVKIPEGIYPTTGKTISDGNLTDGNIKSGVSIFGITGSYGVKTGSFQISNCNKNSSLSVTIELNKSVNGHILCIVNESTTSMILAFGCFFAYEMNRNFQGAVIVSAYGQAFKMNGLTGHNSSKITFYFESESGATSLYELITDHFIGQKLIIFYE